MERCIGELHLKDCLIHLHDIIIYSDTVESHFQRLEAVFRRLEMYHLKIKGSQCEFFRTQVQYLGHIAGCRGIETDPDKIKVLKEYLIRRSIKDLGSFLGFSGYFRRFIKDYAQIARLLNDMLTGIPTNRSDRKSKEQSFFSWGPEAKTAFDTLIEKLTTAPVLEYADYSCPFILNVDASTSGLDAVLYQTGSDGKEHVVSYASRGLRPSERRYAAHKLEFLALKWAICDNPRLSL